MASLNVYSAIGLAIALRGPSQFAPCVAPSTKHRNKGAFKGKGQRKANKANRWR